VGLLPFPWHRLPDGSAPPVPEGRLREEADAQTALAKLKTSLDSGTYVEPSKITLAEYAGEWLKRRQATGTGLKATTAANYKRYVEQDIVPSKLGQMMLTDIRRTHINDFVVELIAAGRGAVTVRRILARLQTIMQTAVRDEIIPGNPALDADKPALGDDPVKVWELEDVREFLQRSSRHRLGPLFEIAVLTGLRRGELCGLHWSDVDLLKRKIVVRHNRVTVDGHVQEQKTPKTKAGLRTVPLSDIAVAALLAWHLRQGQEAENAAEAWVGDGHVFTLEDGRPLDPAYVTRLFQVVRKAGDEPLPELSFHGLRHSAASLMLAGGADISTVSKLLGHASITVTSDVYGHLIGTIAQKAVDGAANLIALTVHSPEGADA
jgi:integrase